MKKNWSLLEIIIHANGNDKFKTDLLACSTEDEFNKFFKQEEINHKTIIISELQQLFKKLNHMTLQQIYEKACKEPAFMEALLTKQTQYDLAVFLFMCDIIMDTALDFNNLLQLIQMTNDVEFATDDLWRLFQFGQNNDLKIDYSDQKGIKIKDYPWPPKP